METLIFAEHSSVLPVWKQRDLRQRTLVYLDAHLDLKQISDLRLQRLRNCQTAEEMAQLEKPHFLVTDEGYSFSIEDFLYPAHRLGFIERLIWVCPGEQVPDLATVLKRALQFLEGVPLEDLQTLKRHGEVLEAKLFGLPVVIASYQYLKHLQLPPDSLIDIDIDYFISTATDRPWVNPQKVFQALQELALRSELVTLTRSVSSGFTPLRYSFIADYLAALFRGDERQATHFARLYELDEQAQRGELATALQGCLSEAEQFAECPATYYLASLCEATEERQAAARNRAVALCASYRRSVLRSACGVINRTRKFELAKLVALENRLQQEESTAADEAALTDLIMGMLCSHLGLLGKTLGYHFRYKKAAGRHARLNAALGLLLNEQGQARRALPFFRAALSEDQTRPRAYLHLGMLYLQQKNYQAALENLLPASQLLPAFREPVRMLAHLYERIGDREQYRFMLKRYQEMNRIIAT
ncbi:MAG: tetratricopeptide repeat protein [Acidobacteria bacterium]|nr:tetratricopeptide repeat protein [Acidobacteriota bacterium]